MNKWINVFVEKARSLIIEIKFVCSFIRQPVLDIFDFTPLFFFMEFQSNYRIDKTNVVADWTGNWFSSWQQNQKWTTLEN